MRRHASCDSTASGTRNLSQSSATRTASPDASCSRCATSRAAAAFAASLGSVGSWSGRSTGGSASTVSDAATRTSAAADTTVLSLTYIWLSPRVMSSKQTSTGAGLPAPSGPVLGTWSWSLQLTECGWILTFSPRRVASVAFMPPPACCPAPGTSSRPMSGYMPTASTALTREPAPAFPDASRRLRTKPREDSAETSCCRIPRSMLSVAPLSELRVLNCRSPPPPPRALACSHPTNARATARWSEPPPASSENPRRAARPPSRPPSTDTTNGDLYADAHATVNTGSRTPSKVAYRSILPTRGCTGISPRCLPSRVRPSSSFIAPMS